MPNCFQLTKKGEFEPKELQLIDDEMWVKLTGTKPELNDKWYLNWYNLIGLALACGKSLEWCVNEFAGNPLEKVAQFLEANYTTDAWFEHK